MPLIGRVDSIAGVNGPGDGTKNEKLRREQRIQKELVIIIVFEEDDGAGTLHDGLVLRPEDD